FTAGLWALSGGLRRYAARDPFGGYFLLAAFIWNLGLLGFLLHPFRYSIPWYLLGFARPFGVCVIFLGLLREQVRADLGARARPLGQGASGVSVAERRAVFTSLLEDDPAVPFPRDVVTRMRGEGLRSVLAIPLAGQTGEVYGALSVFYLRQHDFTPGDVELLSAFGTQASVAIENGRSFDALGRRARHDEQLHDFAQHLLQITDEDE